VRLIFFATLSLELDKVEKCGPRTLNQKQQPRALQANGRTDERTGENVAECALRVRYCEPLAEWGSRAQEYIYFSR